MSDRHCTGSKSSGAFTLLEVLAMVMLIAVGLAAIIGIIRTGARLQREAAAMGTAMPTALSVLHDLNPPGAENWTLASGSVPGASSYFAPTTSVSFSHQGNLNGYFVRRSEASQREAAGGGPDVIDGRARYAFVEVEVYDGIDGALLASIKRRLLRTWANP